MRMDTKLCEEEEKVNGISKKTAKIKEKVRGLLKLSDDYQDFKKVCSDKTKELNEKQKSQE